MVKWPGQRKARSEVRRCMNEARDAVRKACETGDPIYRDIARIWCKTARAFHRNAWRGPKHGTRS